MLHGLKGLSYIVLLDLKFNSETIAGQPDLDAISRLRLDKVLGEPKR
jgi:hypothetical protein